MTLLEMYENRCSQNNDIAEHLPILKDYAEDCDNIVELGVRSIVSTWAFLMGHPKSLISVDIKHPSLYKDHDPDGCDLGLVKRIAKQEGINFAFYEGSSLEISITNADLIFFDTLHTYEQLKEELALHGNSSRKYLIFHDTVTCGNEIMPAIYEFMDANPKWRKFEEFFNNNGLLILKKL